MDILVESKKKVITNAPVITKDTSSTSRGGNAVPSGFILKLIFSKVFFVSKSTPATF